MKNVLPFLQDLKENNSREWFQANRQRYEQARDEFRAFITSLLPGLTGIDKELGGLEPAKCIFRIFRDVRFSHDKSPYKTNMGAFMSKGGRKGPFAGYYIHVEPGNVFAGGGIWMPPGPVLKAVRQEIYYNADEFSGIIEAPGFRKYFDGLMGERLKRPPRDFPADFPHIEMLKYKNYAVGHQMDDTLLGKADMLTRLLEVYRSLYPFNTFINRALADF
jgi:uncharacterized protein (TIGR02453 family)